jgi:hypothetical protein
MHRFLPLLGTLILGVTQASAQWSLCDSLPLIDPSATLDLAGKWHLDFRADTGRAAGRTLHAELFLTPTTELQRTGKSVFDGSPVIHTSYVYWGALSTDLRRLGALRSGNVRSMDPMVPGVRVHARRERLGTTPFLDLNIELRAEPPNDHWEVVLDGAYTVLNVSALNGESMAGIWESGGGEMAIAARGRFCGGRRR